MRKACGAPVRETALGPLIGCGAPMNGLEWWVVDDTGSWLEFDPSHQGSASSRQPDFVAVGDGDVCEQSGNAEENLLR